MCQIETGITPNWGSSQMYALVKLWKSKELQGEGISEASYYVSLKYTHKKYLKTFLLSLFQCEPFISTSS